MRRARLVLVLLLPVATLGVLAGRWLGHAPGAGPVVWRRPSLLSEAEARRRFMASYPGQKALNWAIGDAAIRFHRSRPMGRFVLGLGQPGNDCDDFTSCCIDEGLGVGARFGRNSAEHLLAEREGLFEWAWWRPGDDVQPGDVLTVRHSPWYAPSDSACWHCGIVGSDGWVYDFSKLRSWKSPRYGRHTVAAFTRHSLGKRQVLRQRLHYLYRYRQRELPPLSSALGREVADPRRLPAPPSPDPGPEG